MFEYLIIETKEYQSNGLVDKILENKKHIKVKTELTLEEIHAKIQQRETDGKKADR